MEGQQLLSPEEYQIAAAALTLLATERGWAGDLDNLMAIWPRIVALIEGGYPMGIDDYLNDLDARSMLDEALPRIPAAIRDKLMEMLKPWDERFIQATVATSAESHWLFGTFIPAPGVSISSAVATSDNPHWFFGTEVPRSAWLCRVPKRLNETADYPWGNYYPAEFMPEIVTGPASAGEVEEPGVP